MGRFIKLQKNKQYFYSPRYYDERKERLEKRKEEIAQEMVEEKKILSDSNYADNIKGHMRGVHKYRQREEMKTNFRLVLIICALVAILYFVFLR